MPIKYYGNDSETIAKTDKGIFIIDSVDFWDQEYEQIDHIPDNCVEIDPQGFIDLFYNLPDEIL